MSGPEGPWHVGLVCPYDLGLHGGVQDQVRKLAAWLDDAGHRVTVVAPGDPDRIICPAGEVVAVGPARRVRANRSEAPIALDPRVGRRVIGALAGCDVVHVHEPLMPMVSMAALRSAAPVVATFHADAPAPVRRGARVAATAVRRLLGAAVVTAVSPVAASVVAGVVPVRLVPNGIDLGRWREVGAGVLRQARSVVFVGRDDRRKGLDVLLAAWPGVVARFPDAVLDIVGATRPGPGSPGVTYHGPVDEDAKIRVLAGAEVLVAPNTSGESFGIVLVEGMAAGCALAASALPGFVHVGGDAARWVAPGDTAGLGDTLARLLGDDVARSRLADRGADRVGRFDRAVVLAGYVEAYRDARKLSG